MASFKTVISSIQTIRQQLEKELLEMALATFSQKLLSFGNDPNFEPIKVNIISTITCVQLLPYFGNRLKFQRKTRLVWYPAGVNQWANSINFVVKLTSIYTLNKVLTSWLFSNYLFSASYTCVWWINKTGNFIFNNYARLNRFKTQSVH